LGVAVADVSGKGIAASLLMAICRTNLRQIASHQDSPAAVLCELNRAMAGQTGHGMFITMIYAIVDPAAGEIVFARAGHERPLFLPHGGGRGEYLASEGMPVGLVAPHLFEPVLADLRVPFTPGDVLVLYTDGITEAPNASGQEFSGARLADVVRAQGEQSPREINDAILQAVLRFSGREDPHDDLTLVTMKRA
jgi:sigma-B regulation protein RsbU (phosphoserine phosphatase)